jgi:hypothetical protein
MTLAATTELEAVNIMLAAISEAPVTTLSGDTIDDATVALSTLRDYSKAVQAEGWHFNTDYDYPISVDGDLKLPYPATAAHADPMDYESWDLVKRGAFFYDRVNRQFTFPASTTVKFMVKWMLDFEDLPQLWRNYIALGAARRFVGQQLGDPGAYQYSDVDERRARALAVADDLRRADSNILYQSNSARRVLSRRTTWRG